MQKWFIVNSNNTVHIQTTICRNIETNFSLIITKSSTIIQNPYQYRAHKLLTQRQIANFVMKVDKILRTDEEDINSCKFATQIALQCLVQSFLCAG